MEVACAKAQPFDTSESAAWSVHADSGRSEGIVRGEDERAPVLSTVVWCVWRSSKNIMPFQYVRLGRMGGDVWGWLRRESGVFAS